MFRVEWAGLVRVSFDRAVRLRVPSLVRAHPLRSADAVQLASALLLASRLDEVCFACCDGRLLGAARATGLATFDPRA